MATYFYKKRDMATIGVVHMQRLSHLVGSIDTFPWPFIEMV